MLIKNYVQEIETLTKQKMPELQITELSKALRETEFAKLPTEVSDKLRDVWKNQRNNLIAEWERNTGSTWPVFKKAGEVHNGEILKNDMRYEGHHIIQLNHGGPNAWWNLAPLHNLDHIKLHSSGGAAYIIFKQKIKKN